MPDAHNIGLQRLKSDREYTKTVNFIARHYY